MITKTVAFYKAMLAAIVLIAATPVMAASAPEVDKHAVTIWSQGVRLAGDLYKPKNLAVDEKLPGLLLVPGWGGVKKNLEANYAPYFAQQGFLVLAFDFKSWGESDGPVVLAQALPYAAEATEVSVKANHIRKFVNPLSMSEDVRAALHYLGSEPQVMPNNLGIWGTSMGGGLALVAAATDDRIKALVDQMGPVNYTHNLREIPANYIRHVEAQVARGKLPAFPGPSGKPNPALRGYPDWVTMKRFNPLDYIDQVTAPALFIDAKAETLYDREKNGQLAYESLKDRIESHYIVYPGGHYDMYKGDNLVAGRAAAIEWFVKHLKK